jgi:hypothetical protein
MNPRKPTVGQFIPRFGLRIRPRSRRMSPASLQKSNSFPKINFNLGAQLINFNLINSTRSTVSNVVTLIITSVVVILKERGCCIEYTKWRQALLKG